MGRRPIPRPLFLKAGKIIFCRKHPAHSVRAILVGFFFCLIWLLTLVYAVEFVPLKRACFRVRLNLLFSLARSRVLQRRFAAALFSLVRKKVPKKYAEGVRTLSTPGDAVKLRLRFAPQVLRRYWKIPQYVETQNTQFFFTSQRLRANTSVFFEICEFLLYWVLVSYLSLGC